MINIKILSKRQIILLVAILIVGLSIIFATKYFYRQQNFVMPPMSVKAMEIIEEETWQEIPVAGFVASEYQDEILSQIEGRVSYIGHFPEGIIHKGDIILTIDNSVYKNELEAAQSALNEAEMNLERGLTLAKSKSISNKELLQLKVQFSSAEAKLSQAERNFQKAVITAPAEGKIGVIKPKLGSIIKAGDKITTIEHPGGLFINFELAAKYHDIVKLKDPVVLMNNNEEITTYISSIDPHIDFKRQNFAISSSLSNCHSCKLGEYLEGYIIAGKEQAIMVPEDAVIFERDGQFVYVVEENKAKKRKITPVRRMKNKVVIGSGLTVKETVITAGQIKLHDGVEVNVSK